jgi:acetyl-CoA C-acetyltransferase/3-oxo-5,6-didehydrosuberyl-CoA/3-oxoadipyl-CoA thiolase
MERSLAESLGLTILAIVGPSAAAGVDPAFMGLGPIAATRKALHRAERSIDDVGVIELNEAFAAQSIACIRELDLDLDRVNLLGGAIAMGHPLGCSGARIATTLIHQMNRQEHELGLATLCIGVGQGLATLFVRP